MDCCRKQILEQQDQDRREEYGSLPAVKDSCVRRHGSGRAGGSHVAAKGQRGCDEV